MVHDMKGRILFTNQAGRDFYGLQHSELVGASVFDFIPPEYHATLLSRKEQRNLGDVGMHLYEIEFINNAGQRIPIEVNSTSFLHDGKEQRILKKILLVDDEASIVKMEQQMLERLGVYGHGPHRQPGCPGGLQGRPPGLRPGGHGHDHAEPDRGAVCCRVEEDQTGHTGYLMHRLQLPGQRGKKQGSRH